VFVAKTERVEEGTADGVLCARAATQKREQKSRFKSRDKANFSKEDDLKVLAWSFLAGNVSIWKFKLAVCALRCRQHPVTTGPHAKPFGHSNPKAAGLEDLACDTGRSNVKKKAVRTYTVSAKYYDAAYAAKKDLVDLPFYVELAKKYGGPVLEIGCGTGRVLLPIVREGVEIHGADQSPAMLRVLKKRLKSESREVRSKVRLFQGDMRTVRLKKKYSLVIMPFRPLQHMHTLKDQIAALTSAAAHLNKGGVFAFDVFLPKFEGIAAAIGQKRLELEWNDPEDATKVVRRYYRMESWDKINQTFAGTFRFEIHQGEKLLAEETETLRMTYYLYPQLRALFLLADLEAVKEYGSFAKTPLDDTAEQMVFLVRKRKSGR